MKTFWTPEKIESRSKIKVNARRKAQINHEEAEHHRKAISDDKKSDDSLELSPSHRPLSSSFLGLPYRNLNINHKKELLRGLWVNRKPLSVVAAQSCSQPWELEVVSRAEKSMLGLGLREA